MAEVVSGQRQPGMYGQHWNGVHFAWLVGAVPLRDLTGTQNHLSILSQCTATYGNSAAIVPTDATYGGIACNLCCDGDDIQAK